MDAGGGQIRQQHGMDFETWIKTTFFQSFNQTGVTDKWDALDVAFKAQYATFTAGFSGLPVSMKTCKYGTSIGFGDAVQQFENTKDFLLIIAFWSKAGAGKKIVSIKAVKITAAEWHSLFLGVVTKDELEKDQLAAEDVKTKIYQLDKTIKTTPSYVDARKQAQTEKKALPAMEIVLNPKIDSKNQRRLQCSLPFNVFWTKFAREAASVEENPTLWGEPVPLLK